MLCSAQHHRIARANVTSTSRVDVPVTRKTVVVRSRGRSGRVSTRASGDDGNGRGQDVQNDWDGAWRAFKRDFVGEDAKMPGDYVETKFKSKRYVWNFARRRRPFPSRVYARTHVRIYTDARSPGYAVPLPRAQTLSRRRRQATDLRRRGSRIKFRHIQLLFRRRRHRCRRFTLSLRRRHRSAPERRSVLASLVRLNYRHRCRRRVIQSFIPPSRCKTKLKTDTHQRTNKCTNK